MAANGSGAAAGPTELEKKIIRQVEYYFGDSNLAKDKFLQSQVKEDDGWVPLEVMVRFNRLKTLSDDYEVIATALAKSTSGLMEISEDKQKVRRSLEKPIPNDTTEHRSEVKKRTIYCKGFKLDDSLDTVQSFLDQFGLVQHVQMRRDAERKFKGSVFATFDKEESVTKFLEAKDLKIGDTEAIKMLKDEYYKMKNEEQRVRREKATQEKRQAREQREQEAIEAHTAQANYGDFVKGCVMFFKGVTDQTSREDLKEVFGEYGTISWVDFERGQTEGHIRFEEDSKAADVIEKATKAAKDGKIIVREKELTVRVLEGEEEEEHWKKVYETKSRIRLRKQMRGRKRGGPRDGGRDGGRQSKSARYAGKKTVFQDSDGEGEQEEMKEGVKKEKEAPSASGDAPTAAQTSEAVSSSPAKSDVKQEPVSSSPAKKDVKQEPVSSSPTKTAVKRPLEEETSEAEPAKKAAK